MSLFQRTLFQVMLARALLSLFFVAVARPARAWRTPEAPEVLVVIADDLGWDLLRKAPTPNLDRISREGLVFTEFWVTPYCAPTRASILSGKYHFRIGSGEVGNRHSRRSMSLGETLLPELLEPDQSAAFGKWHLSTDPHHPNRSGFGLFAGTLRNLNHDSYFHWAKVRNGVESVCDVYATVDVTNEAIASSALFKYVAYHAPHAPLHDPPASLAPSSARDGTPESQLLAMTEALDSEIGRLASSHPSAWLFILGDNGSLPDGGKGSLLEKGINVPLIVRSPLDLETPSGSSDALVHAVDLFATIAELWGVPSQAEDSVSFLPVLRGQPGQRTWNYTCIYPEGQPNHRFEAVRDQQFKLVVHRDGSHEGYSMPGEVPLVIEEQSLEIRQRFEKLEEVRRRMSGD